MTVAATAARQQRGKRHPAESFPQPTALLAWYDRHRRVLPWRAPPGQAHRSLPGVAVRNHAAADHRQGGRAVSMRAFWRAGRMCRRWPRRRSTIFSKPGPVSAITHARVISMPAPVPWSSATADNFRKPKTNCGRCPASVAYTAAAIAAIAYDAPAMPVDGNIERVIARLYAVETPLPAAKPEIARLARALTPAHRSGDFAQAAMDLGATICTPKRPACALCPWNDGCAAHQRGDAEALPRARRSAKARCAAALLSSHCAPTALCWCGRGPNAASLAA